MKKRWLIGVLGLISAASICTFGKSLVAAPKLYISGDSWDFGTVKTMKSLEHSFQIENRGNADLILAVWPSCHRCIGPTLTATKIPPAGKAKLSVELHIVKAGLNEPYVMIETNDPEQRLRKVTVKALAQLDNTMGGKTEQ